MKSRIVAGAMAMLLAWLWASPSGAVFLDEERTVQITGKGLVQTGWRMQESDSDGRACLSRIGSGYRACEEFTFPTTKTGHLIQERNLVDVEFFHNVAGWLGSDFTALDALSYRLRFKYFYDTLYDIGPDRYRNPSQHPVPTDKYGLRNARHLAHQHDPLWNAYVDAAKGPVKLRVGRQDLSWGESDGFRLLDMIEPLDSRFGFPLVEDLDDRRIPLWMVRPTIGLGTVGPISNLTLDGYWVPGPIDHQEAPVTPTGNPFAAPNPPGSAIVKIPAKTMRNSRGGGRIMGSVLDNALTLSIGHYVTFNDYPSARLFMQGVNFPSLDFNGDSIPDLFMLVPNAPFLVEFYQQQVTGASGTFALPFDPYTIVRTEIANFWDERVFIPAQSVGLASARFQQTGQPSRGALPRKNILRWMIGLDRNVWIRRLNPENTFYLSAQYFHTNILNYDRDIANAIVNRQEMMTLPAGTPPFGLPAPLDLPGATSYVNRRNNEIIVTYLANTLVYHGNIQPQVFGMYDTRGVHGVVPSISYQYGNNWVFTLKYAFIAGNLANLGLFRDRDQLVFRVQYNLS